MQERNLPLALFYVLVVIFLFFPILIVVPISFSNGRFLSFPPEEFGLRWYINYFNEPVWMAATFRSLRVALGASILATFVGTLSVIGLGRKRSKTSGALTALFVAPAIVPNIIVALGVFILAVRMGVSDNELTLICAHAAIGLPFVVLMVGSAYRQIDPTLERAARIMGAGPLRAFLTATLPPLTPAILSAGIFAFFVSFDELIISLFLMSSAETLPMRIWNDLRFEINPTIAAVSVFFVVVTTLAMTIAELLRRRAEKNNAA
ncbi:Inner membrane ABC transporter permease protein YdcV [Falsiruegeria litorea R37]|uniref:Inner membrane ABC transporter permease protein YdcV n=1 Tax=Falsiruegeria litorea R37 TaxID=1200284 RepID=A0A1Y5TSU9_9RHOB|nr:ABC transporter permease [Falsiruegeria litorea]SLN71529.1 Inner membrane ABC transporter permease protein YdcV [Falsiruegeria litorea R37]